MARSSATQHITLEYRKCCGSPRTSQMPWSFSRHRLAAVSAQATQEPLGVVVDGRRAGRRAGAPRRAARRTRRSAAGSTPRCRPAPAGCPASPARCGSSRSVRSCSPPMPNMICRPWSGPIAGRGRGGHEREEVVGLVRAGGDPQRLHREARVAHPGVAVVPVALAADALRQRRRRRGDDRAAGLEGQTLQHAAAVVHQVGPRARRRPGAAPTTTATRRRCRRPRRRARPATRRAPGCLLQRRAVQREVHRLAGAQRAAGRARATAASVSGGGRGQHQPLGAAARGHPTVHRGQQRHDQAVLRAGLVGDSTSTSPPVHATRRTSRCGTSRPSRCPPLSGPSASASVSTSVPAGGRERRLQHQRPVEVAPGARPVADRLDLPVPGRPRRAAGRRPTGCRTEGSPATPPSRPVSPARRVAVGQQRVVGDGR